MINLRSILTYSNASLIKHKGFEGFGCICCSLVLPTAVELKAHFVEEHSNKKTISKLQNKQFENSAKLDISFLNCAVCNKDMDSLDQLIAHLSDYHDVETYSGIINTILPFKFEKEGLHCAICDLSHGSFKMLTEHMNRHFRNYICSICDAGFMSQQVYRAHLLRHGTGETCPCNHCDRVFSSAVKLKDHVNSRHLRIKRNKCDLCDERFSDYCKKTAHMRQVHLLQPDMFVCNACGRNFTSQRTLRIHVKKDHLLERTHECKECGKAFFTKWELADHQHCHEEVKVYPCTVDGCRKAYSRKKTFLLHLRSAHAEKMDESGL